MKHLPPFLAAVLLFAAACATNPATGKRQFNLMSEAQEISAGQQADAQVKMEMGIYNDPNLQEYVSSIGMKLASVSERPTLPWHYTVVDAPAVNAFALPGGYIYITRGILPFLNDEAQLAGVLGHEIGHVTARHSAQQITRQQIAGIGVIAGAVFVPAFRPYSVIAQQGLGLLFLQYSRDNETQADQLGIEYAMKANYDPRQIPATYATLKRIGDKVGSSLPSFLSTHPDPGDREVRTTQLSNAAASSAHRPLDINEVEYRQHMDGLVYGDDPRAGYFIANRFYHPGLKFQIIFPQGWQTANQPSQVIALNQGAGAAMQLTLVTTKAEESNFSPADYVASLKRKGEITRAEGRSENFRDFPAWVGIVSGGGEGKDLVAAWVRMKPGQFLQVLGQAGSQSAADQIFASIRTIAALTDPAKINVSPDRIVVKPAPMTAPFSEIWSAIGGGAVGLEDAAILNSTRPATVIATGAPVKTVVKGTKPQS
jgi:predicted Zn-dependent protease